MMALLMEDDVLAAAAAAAAVGTFRATASRSLASAAAQHVWALYRRPADTAVEQTVPLECWGGVHWSSEALRGSLLSPGENRRLLETIPCCEKLENLAENSRGDAEYSRSQSTVIHWDDLRRLEARVARLEDVADRDALDVWLGEAKF